MRVAVGRGRARAALITLTAGAVLTTTRPAAADGESVVVGLGGIHLRKQIPARLVANSLVGRVEGGWRLGPRTAGRLRLEGFRADGLNLFAALVVDVELGAGLGLSGFSGFSVGSRSGIGSNLGVGGFARWSIARCWSARVDGYLTSALRNDFSGFGVGAIVGAQWRP